MRSRAAASSSASRNAVVPADQRHQRRVGHVERSRVGAIVSIDEGTHRISADNLRRTRDWGRARATATPDTAVHQPHAAALGCRKQCDIRLAARPRSGSATMPSTCSQLSSTISMRRVDRVDQCVRVEKPRSRAGRAPVNVARTAASSLAEASSTTCANLTRRVDQQPAGRRGGSSLPQGREA